MKIARANQLQIQIRRYTEKILLPRQLPKVSFPFFSSSQFNESDLRHKNDFISFFQFCEKCDDCELDQFLNAPQILQNTLKMLSSNQFSLHALQLLQLISAEQNPIIQQVLEQRHLQQLF